MAFERAVQSLSFIEEKLRRAFNLAGPIGAALNAGSVTPVIIAHDLRDPGHSSASGRCWTWFHDQAGTPAGVNVVSVLFGADVLVEALIVTGAIAANLMIEAYHTTPAEAIPIAPTAITGVWRDRRTVATDVAPLSSNAGGWGALTGTAINATNRLQVWKEPAPNHERRMQIMVTQGSAITFRSNGANASLSVGMWGRIWP